MKNIVYWFSGSGNSLHVAKRIAAGINAEIRPLALFKERELERGNMVGIVCPVYSFGIPRMVIEVLRNIPKDFGEYIFGVLTYASQPGYAGLILEKAVEKSCNHLSACYGVDLPTNYPPLGGAQTVNKQNAYFKSAPSQIDEVITKIKDRLTGHFERKNFPMRVMGQFIFPLFLSSLGKADKKFFADDNCTSCGLCERVCPVGNITVDGKPQWLGHCEQCYACFHWCPENAIQFGKKTAEQIRYQHPDVTLADILKQTNR